jgi:AcrR family transcriptional regulator
MLASNNKTALRSQAWIINALLELMKENEYNKITVIQLCHKADLDRRTFYRNFISKDDVLEQYVFRLGEEYIEMFHTIKTPSSQEAIQIFFEFWTQHLSFIQNIQICGLSDFVFQRFQTFSREHKELFIGTVNDKISTEFAFSYRIGGFWNVMLSWAAQSTILSASEMASILSGELE